VLDQLSAPLCEAVLAESGAQEQLRGLGGLELVLDPAGSPAGMVPYHALFREFLLVAEFAGSSPTPR